MHLEKVVLAVLAVLGPVWLVNQWHLGFADRGGISLYVVVPVNVALTAVFAFVLTLSWRELRR